MEDCQKAKGSVSPEKAATGVPVLVVPAAAEATDFLKDPVRSIAQHHAQSDTRAGRCRYDAPGVHSPIMSSGRESAHARDTADKMASGWPDLLPRRPDRLLHID